METYFSMKIFLGKKLKFSPTIWIFEFKKEWFRWKLFMEVRNLYAVFQKA